MVGGDDEAVFQQGNAPADQDNLPQRQRRGGGFDVPIPRKRHDEVGQGEQGDDDEDVHRNVLSPKSEGGNGVSIQCLADAVNKKCRLPESSLHFVLQIYFAADAPAGAEAAAWACA